MTSEKPPAVVPSSWDIPSGMTKLTSAPTNAQTASKYVGLIRSLRLKTALASAPSTNPSCTLMVSHETPAGESFHSSLRALVTAEAENQRAIASHCTTASTTSCRHFMVNGSQNCYDGSSKTDCVFTMA